jgi:Fe-coproporphyrin III synthase
MKESTYKERGRETPPTMRTPQSVDVDITSRCNLRCRYCYYFDNEAVSYIDLPTGDWLQFFDELGKCAVMEVCLAGGEPFIREDLPELLEGIVRNRMRFSILSNGTLIDEDIAAFIASTGRCNYVQVSVDGSTSEVHDSCRGKGSFVGAMRGIRVLQQCDLPVEVRVTIHHQNVYDLENIAHMLLEDLGLKRFSTNSSGFLGTCRLNQEDVLLSPSDRITAMKTLLQLREKYKGKISAAAGPLAEALEWGKMEMARKSGNPADLNGGHLIACGCTRSRIAVRSDGIITPCPLLSHIELGRINHDPLAEVWQGSPELSALRHRESLSLMEFEFCRECPYTPYCTGNCPSMAYSLTGQLDHPSPDACLLHFIKEAGTSAFLDDLLELKSAATISK